MKSFLLGMFLILFSLGTLACAENNKTGEEKFLYICAKCFSRCKCNRIKTEA